MPLSKLSLFAVLALSATALSVTSAGAKLNVRSANGAPSPIASFPVGRAHSAPTTALVSANGTAYLAYSATNSAGLMSAYVCVLPRGARACSKSILLPPLDRKTAVLDSPNSLLFGSGGTVDVLVTTSDDLNKDDRTKLGDSADTLEYRLTAGGSLMGAAKRIGTLDSQGDAINYRGQILWVSGDTDTGTGAIGLQESPADNPKGGFQNIPHPIEINLKGTAAANEEFFYGSDVVALANGHLLISWQDLASQYTVEVDPAHGFKVVGSSIFKGFIAQNTGLSSELATGPRGVFLLLRSSTDGSSGKLRVYKYAKKGHFGPPRGAPSPASTDAGYGDVRLVQQADGVLDIFYDKGFLVEETSYNSGKTWSRPFTYPNATPLFTPNIAPSLTSFGAGVVFEASGGTAANGIHPRVQPVLVHQSVTLSLTPNPVLVGKHFTASGVVNHAHAGQSLYLQKEVQKHWSTVASTLEKTTGKFSFNPITARSAGTSTYRVQATGIRGWFFVDYSVNRVLVVHKPKKK